jgi:hypothetical protein
MSAKRRTAPPLPAVLVLLAIGASACGGANGKSASNDVVEGEPVTLGGLTFNITSRYLHPDHGGDAAYVAGQPPPAKGLSYYAVFVEVQNESAKPKAFPAMSITDAVGTLHAAYPVATPYARHFGEVVKPHEHEPAIDSIRRQGAVQPSLVLFRLSPGSDRLPLTLHIGSEGSGEGKIRLNA